jgi:osmotically inducible protein OsmC
MAAVSRADASWDGDLKDGSGNVKPASGAFAELPVTWASRTDRSEGTSPEELIAAAHAACYSMALSNELGKAGHEQTRVRTTAEVEFVPGTGITTITLTVRGTAAKIDEHEFKRFAEMAKDGCPVSQLVKGNVELKLDAALG